MSVRPAQGRRHAGVNAAGGRVRSAILATALLLCGCGSGVGSSAEQTLTQQSAKPFTSAAPTGTPIPPNAQSPFTQDVRLGVADNGRTIYIAGRHVVHVLLNAPEGYPFYSWTSPSSSDSSILRPEQVSQAMGGASADFRTIAVGQATVSARTQAECEPNCHPPFTEWEAVVVVV